MELWDVLDSEGKKTGRIIAKGQATKEGEYFLAVHVFIMDKNGRFLIQKRSMKKALYPGRWDITGGAVLSGEDSLAGAQREVQEEVGLALPANAFSYISRLFRKGVIFDVWAASADFSIDDIVMQEGEVDDVRLVEPQEMLRIVFDVEFVDVEYKKLIADYIKSAGLI